MATLYWRGDATAVAGVETGSVDTVSGTPSDSTYTVTIGGVAIDEVGDTDVATTATNLRATLNASTHPYFAAITWSGSAGDIIGTADTAGVPFIAALTVAGGTGTVTDFVETTASAGPSDWSTGENWVNAATGATGTIPASADDVVIENSTNSIVYGLDQNAVALDSLEIRLSFTGKIGMERRAFMTAADGLTADSTKAEYREDYLKIGAEVVDIGQAFGTGTQSGSTRIKIDNVDAAATTTTIHNTATTGDTPYPAVRLLVTHASSTLLVRRAPGGVGIGIDEPGETSSLSSITVSDSTPSTRIVTGEGLTLTTWTQTGGSNLLRVVDAGTVTTVNVSGGSLVTQGDFTITTLNATGGTSSMNHSRTAGISITTANLTSGTVRTRSTATARTWTTVNLGDEISLLADSNLTITTLNEPTDPYNLTISPG
jgi:hypothetical protein